LQNIAKRQPTKIRTGKEIKFRFGSSEDKADTASRTCLPAGRAAAGQKWKIIYLQVLRQQSAETPVATQRGQWLWHGWSLASGIGKDGDRK
jgi:hypothetical protein